jgi:hypothetical protein
MRETTRTAGSSPANSVFSPGKSGYSPASSYPGSPRDSVGSSLREYTRGSRVLGTGGGDGVYGKESYFDLSTSMDEYNTTIDACLSERIVEVCMYV